MPYIDIDLLKNNNDKFYDINFGSDGDFIKTEGFNMALKISLMCERRASESEVALPQFRRGWWGNEFLGFDNFEIGSKLWLLNQTRATQNTLNNSITYTQNSLQWLITDNYLSRVHVTANYEDNGLNINIDLIRSNNLVESYGYSLWDNTLKEENGKRI